MKRLLVVLILLVATTTSADVRGAWTAIVHDDGSALYLNLSVRPWHQLGRSIRLSEFANLPIETVRAASATPVLFELRREAGTIFFEGTFKLGDGAGHLTFAPNRNFVSAMKEIGLAIEPRGTRTLEDELFNLALVDVSTEYVRQMRSAGLPVATARDAVRLRAAGVTRAFIADLAAVGYTNLSERDLIRLSASGVNADFIRTMSRYKEKSP